MSLKATFPNAKFGDPALPDEIFEVERSLGIAFPRTLRELYLECDGFREPIGNAKYLLSLTSEDFIGSLFAVTRSLWADREYWKSAGIDLTEFIFFGFTSADEIWGIRVSAPHDVIEYHHNQDEQLTHLGGDLLEIFRNDFQKYEC